MWDVELFQMALELESREVARPTQSRCTAVPGGLVRVGLDEWPGIDGTLHTGREETPCREPAVIPDLDLQQSPGGCLLSRAGCQGPSAWVLLQLFQEPSDD